MIPTLTQWMERYEAEYESGQTRITPTEAAKRYYKRYPDDMDDYEREQAAKEAAEQGWNQLDSEVNK